MLLPNILKMFSFSVVYGYMENRFFYIATRFKYHNGYRYLTLPKRKMLNHFKRYHIFMGILFLLASLCSDIRTTLFNLLMGILVEDAAWFLFEGRFPRDDDWTCWPFYKLVFGLPWWYWLFGLLLTVIALI
jgi:hypothetical protein